jgi:hypothetical protein
MNKQLKLTILGAAAIIPAAATFAGAMAAGGNFFTNADFSSGVAGWQAGTANVPAAIAPSGDGGALVTNLSNLNTSTHGMGWQCIDDVFPGEKYHLRADTFVPSGQARSGGAELRVFYFAQDNCQGAILDSPQSARLTVTDVWAPLDHNSTAPAGTMSAMAALVTAKLTPENGQDKNAPFVVRFDNAKFEHVLPPPPVKDPPKQDTPQVPGNQGGDQDQPQQDPPVVPSNDPAPSEGQPADNGQPSGGSDSGKPAENTPVTVQEVTTEQPQDTTVITDQQPIEDGDAMPQAPDTGNAAHAHNSESDNLALAAAFVSAGLGLGAVALFLHKRRRDEEAA